MNFQILFVPNYDLLGHSTVPSWYFRKMPLDYLQDPVDILSPKNPSVRVPRGSLAVTEEAWEVLVPVGRSHPSSAPQKSREQRVLPAPADSM